MKVYAVIDTNVFVSALFTRNPISATTKILNALADGQIIPLYNEQIIDEYQSVLSREKFHITSIERKKLLDFIREYGIFVERTSIDRIFIDESDRVFYEIALSKEDSFLVTGNLKHYPQEPIVVTPAQMLQIIDEQQ